MFVWRKKKWSSFRKLLGKPPWKLAWNLPNPENLLCSGQTVYFFAFVRCLGFEKCFSPCPGQFIQLKIGKSPELKRHIIWTKASFSDYLFTGLQILPSLQASTFEFQCRDGTFGVRRFPQQVWSHDNQRPWKMVVIRFRKPHGVDAAKVHQNFPSIVRSGFGKSNKSPFRTGFCFFHFGSIIDIKALLILFENLQVFCT